MNAFTFSSYRIHDVSQLRAGIYHHRCETAIPAKLDSRVKQIRICSGHCIKHQNCFPSVVLIICVTMMLMISLTQNKVSP